MHARLSSPGERAVILALTALLTALLGWILINALLVSHPPARHLSLQSTLDSYVVVPPAPVRSVPPKPKPVASSAKRPAIPKKSGSAAPPNQRSRATEIKIPDVKPLEKSPVIAAPIPNSGADASSGASPLPGPGTGKNGSGTGTGAGTGGDGTGGGGGGGTPPVHISGSIHDSDYPGSAAELGQGGTVEVLYAIDPDGRARDCSIERSSGNPALDDTTCRLIEQRFRFRPSRGPDGRPRRVYMEQRHIWTVENLPPPDNRR